MIIQTRPAGNYGSGRRSGGVANLICAVLDDRRNIAEDDELKYRSFVRVGSGFSFSDYVDIRARPWKEYKPNNRPSFLITAEKGNDDKGDVYLEPEQ
jgi:DNA ligase 4